MNNVATMREFLRSAGADLSATEFSVLATLLLHCNTEGQCWPSARAVAEFARVSEKSARRALAAMAARGLITRTARRAAGGGRLSDLISVQGAASTAAGAGERPVSKRNQVINGVLCWTAADAAAVSELVVAHGAATVEAAAERLRRRGFDPLPSRVHREIQAAAAAARRAETRPPRMADDAPVPPAPAREDAQDRAARIERQLRALPLLRGPARAQLAGRLAQVLPPGDPRRAMLL